MSQSRLHLVKRALAFAILVVTMLCLSCCTTYRNPYINQDLTQEKWQREVISSADPFAKGADRWFFNADVSSMEAASHRAPYSRAVSNMAVAVPNFTDVRVEGAFQVQIFGSFDHNSVVIMGPNAGVRQIVVNVNRNLLDLHQSDKAADRDMKDVIVRIGVMNLRNLSHHGCGTVEGIRVRSDGLCVSTGKKARGNMYLAGDMRLLRINQGGDGMISIFGARSDQLKINTSGCGAVNVTGLIGVNDIYHKGSGDINILGAHSTCLTVYAAGRGKIGLYGDHIGITEIRAKDYTRVYAYPVVDHTGHDLNVFTFGHAKVGLMGAADDIYINSAGSSQFYGRYLCVQDAYARASEQSHINISARGKIFAAATQNGSVYFFGSPSLMSQFLRGNGTVIPIWSNGAPNCGVFYPRIKHHPRHRNYKGDQ